VNSRGQRHSFLTPFVLLFVLPGTDWVDADRAFVGSLRLLVLDLFDCGGFVNTANTGQAFGNRFVVRELRDLLTYEGFR